MSTILTSAIVENAKTSVNEYVSTITALNGQLDSIINTLTGDNFQGDASMGYKEFYTAKVVPAIQENLVEGNSLTQSIISMLDNIQQQLLNTVDPQLGNNNRDPSGGAGATVAGAIGG